ncbi:MAG TPA: PQQ-dependent sugar dehydrogenase [Pirellulaceae bacterium]|jgi:putative heme-binding domain-containing protein
MNDNRKTFVFIGLLVVAVSSSAAGKPTSPSRATGRTPWTTSRVIGSPDPPPPYKIVRAFPNMKLEKPLLLTRCPGSDRLFIGEQAGVLYSFKNEPEAKAEVFFDLRKELTTLSLSPGNQGVDNLYGLVFHPDFETNRQCFVCYTLKGPGGGQPNFEDGSRVSRFTVTNTDPPKIDPASEEIVLTYLQGGHNGGDLHFGPDRMLYITTGDAASPNPPDSLKTGQDNSDLLSSILRIDVDHKDAGKNYAVPKDNPFVGMPNFRPEIWAYGFRNPWRMSFDRATGQLFVGDVGWELWEMVHRVERGGNYGWAAMEGPQPIKPEETSPIPITPPLIALPHTLAASVTGGYVYRGHKLPELVGAYIFGDWETRRLWAARFDGDRVIEMPEITRPQVRIVAFGEDNDGELYFLDHDLGTIHTLERNDSGGQNVDFPKAISQTGIFADTASQQPAPGVLPFAINSHQWQDGAIAERWAALPGTSSAKLYSQPKPIPGMVNWHNFRLHFPENAVLAKTISLEGRRIETQLLHYDGQDWQPYTYVWREDQTDADLVPADGSEKEVSVGGKKMTWPLFSRSQCRLCHSAWSEYSLGFQAEQLNRPGSDGRNQLISLSELGLIQRIDAKLQPQPAFDETSAARERQIVDPNDASQPLEARARSYLHANCGHCHAFGGGGAVGLRLQFPVSVSEMLAVGVSPTRGDFGLPGACIIKPGEPTASTLYFRMAKFGRDRMPHLGSERPDEAGLKLIEEWITSLSPSAGSKPAPGPSEALSDVQSALVTARRLARAEMSSPDRDALLVAAAKIPAGPIRDLFEGYFPEDQHGRRLGSSPRPTSILSVKGDVARGEQLFWSTAVNCGSCHKIDGRGNLVGPDLSHIAKQRTREDLLDSLLDPSRRIEPRFAAYVARTHDGRILTGLIINRDATGILLRDAQNKEIVLASNEIDELKPSRHSLMPDGQMASLTAQQAADLLAYLAHRN